jgi:exopolysaccharide biosynthesis polyprenyl glycosylphosphotransferase
MITKREKHLSTIMIVLQVLLAIFIFWLVDFIFPHINISLFDKVFYYSQIAIVWTFLLVKFKMGTIFRMKKLINLLEGYLVMVAIGGSILVAETLLVRLIIGFEGYPLWNILYFSIFSFVALVLFKLLLYNFIIWTRKNSKNERYITLVADDRSETFINRLKESRDWGYQVVSIITPNEEFAKSYKNAVLIRTNEELKKFLSQNVVDELLYCLPINDKSYHVQTVIKNAEEIGITLYLVQESFLQNLKNAKNNELHLNSALDIQTGYNRYFLLELKTLFDMVFSSIALVLLSPLMALIAILIKFEDGGPILFKQQRIGLHGRRFYCYKFRTMVVNAESMLDDLQELNEVDGPVFKIKEDPRITRIGKFLRKTSMDELPQFYNVIKGEMAIVGPRPPLLTEVQQYEYFQLRRLSMKPGITCIWQVEGRNSVTFDEWIEMDLRYIDNWSPWLDVKLIFKTVLVVFKGSGS